MSEENDWETRQQKEYDEIKEGKFGQSSAQGSGSGNGGGGCFVATAAFGNYDTPEVVYLSAFRDNWLNRRPLGKIFVRFYYVFSPPLAALIAKSIFLQSIARNFFLRPVISLLRKYLH